MVFSIVSNCMPAIGFGGAFQWYIKVMFKCEMKFLLNTGCKHHGAGLHVIKTIGFN